MAAGCLGKSHHRHLKKQLACIADPAGAPWSFGVVRWLGAAEFCIGRRFDDRAGTRPSGCRLHSCPPAPGDARRLLLYFVPAAPRCSRPSHQRALQQGPRADKVLGFTIWPQHCAKVESMGHPAQRSKGGGTGPRLRGPVSGDMSGAGCPIGSTRYQPIPSSLQPACLAMKMWLPMCRRPGAPLTHHRFFPVTS